jgi:hypothetical protein
MSFVLYWCENVHTGWEYGHGIFEWIEGTTMLICAFCLCHNKFRKYRDTFEENVMKLAFFIFAAAFLFSTIVCAPYLKYRDISGDIIDDKTLRTVNLRQAEEIQTQNTTIQSLQAQLSDKGSRLADIQAENDPSAKAIKRRALILCAQLLNGRIIEEYPDLVVRIGRGKSGGKFNALELQELIERFFDRNTYQNFAHIFFERAASFRPHGFLAFPFRVMKHNSRLKFIHPKSDGSKTGLSPPENQGRRCEMASIRQKFSPSERAGGRLEKKRGRTLLRPLKRTNT